MDGGENYEQTELDALRAEIAELRATQRQQPNPFQMLGLHGELMADKPEKFKGKPGNAVKSWLVAWETRLNLSKFTEADQDSAVKLAILNCETQTSNHLLTMLDRDEFKTWETFKKFMLERYGPRETDYSKWQQLMSIKQKDNESVSAYG